MGTEANDMSYASERLDPLWRTLSDRKLPLFIHPGSTPDKRLDPFYKQVVATISQETLSEMIGTTRSRVNFFMNKFKKLGFVEYDGDLDKGIQINSSLLSVVLHD